MAQSQTFGRSNFFGHCSFMQLFHDVEKLRRKLLICFKVKILLCTTYMRDSKKNPPEAARVATLVKFFNFEEKNLGMVWFSCL